ncbi:hypothetical protein FACS1894216_15400 [Synergistales bacterium]|nr:hypothetical protein FACS1894216_15400 [Synergistales bacterium]
MPSELNKILQVIMVSLDNAEKRNRAVYDSALDLSDFQEGQIVSADAQRNIFQIREWRKRIEAVCSEIDATSMILPEDIDGISATMQMPSASNGSDVSQSPVAKQILSHDDAVLEDTPIGAYVRQKMRELSNNDHIFSAANIALFQEKRWSSDTFGLDYPFARVFNRQQELSAQTKDDNGYGRYWKEVFLFGNISLLICSQWNAEDKEQLDKWDKWYNRISQESAPSEQQWRPRRASHGSGNPKPTAITLLGETYDVCNWNEMFVKVCEVMLLHKPHIIEALDSDAELNSDRRKNFSYIKKEIKYAPRQLSNGLWVETNRNSGDISRCCNRILAKCSYSPEELSIETNETKKKSKWLI